MPPANSATTTSVGDGPGTISAPAITWSPVLFKASTRADPHVLRARLSASLHMPTPVRVDLFRHGETTLNSLNLVSGARDVPLTDRGRMQAQEFGATWLAPAYDAAFCSPLERSRETLRLALGAARTQVGHVFVDRRLAERPLGVLEGQPMTTIAEFARGDLLFAPPGGDSYLRVALRVLAFLVDVADWARSHGAARILLSTHMGPLRILAAIFEDEPSSRAILARRFANGQGLSYAWSQLRLPAFLAAVVSGQSHP